MRFRFLAQVFTVAIFTCCLSGVSLGETVLLTTSGSTGLSLDDSGQADGEGVLLTELPFTVNVVEIPGLTLTAESGSSTDPGNTALNGAVGSFGLNSPGTGEQPTRFDVDFQELLSISFNQDVLIENVVFTSFSGTETFTFGGVSIADADAPGNTFTFAGDGLAVAADSAIDLFAGGPAGGTVGLVSIDVVLAPSNIPEPSSVALLGLGGVLMLVRRRR